jgi:hypothetical protein
MWKITKVESYFLDCVVHKSTMLHCNFVFIYSFVRSFIHSFILSFFLSFLSFLRAPLSHDAYMYYESTNEVCSIKGIERGNARNKCTKNTTVCFDVFTSCCAPWMISLVRVFFPAITLWYHIHVPACYKWVFYVRSDGTLVHLFQDPCALGCGL